MNKARRRGYTAEFKADAVRMLEEEKSWREGGNHRTVTSFLSICTENYHSRQAQFAALA